MHGLRLQHEVIKDIVDVCSKRISEVIIEEVNEEIHFKVLDDSYLPVYPTVLGDLSTNLGENSDART